MPEPGYNPNAVSSYYNPNNSPVPKLRPSGLGSRPSSSSTSDRKGSSAVFSAPKPVYSSNDNNNNRSNNESDNRLTPVTALYSATASSLADAGARLAKNSEPRVSPMNLYDKKNMQEMKTELEDYLRGVAIEDGIAADMADMAVPEVYTGEADDVTVKAGDTLTAIAKDKGVSLQELIDANPQIANPDMIRPGEKVTMPSAVTTSTLDSKSKNAFFSNQKLTVESLEDSFVDTYLAEHEGTRSHASLEGGRRTGAYGVKNVPAGMSRSDYSSDAEFAAAVSLDHYQKIQRKYDTIDKSKLWKSFPESAQMAILDLQFNVGTIGQTPSKTDVKEALENTLEFVGMTAKDGTKGSLMSLAKRRALNWNKVTDDSSDIKPIKTIKQIPTSTGGTKFEFLDKNDNVVYEFSNGRTPIKLDRRGNTTTLTTTREETL